MVANTFIYIVIMGIIFLVCRLILELARENTKCILNIFDFFGITVNGFEKFLLGFCAFFMASLIIIAIHY